MGGGGPSALRINGTRFGPCCPQTAGIYAPDQHEQCLSLNVFAPHPPPNASELAPVLFFIHGGGATTGCSAQSLPVLYNGSNLLARSALPAVRARAVLRV